MTPSGDALHILIVDDDARICALLQRFLTQNGYRITTAESADKARAVMAGFAFDLMILDIMMPGETGLSLAKSIRANETAAHPKTPFLMLTALAETHDRIGGLEVGADDYLPKPFEPRELLLRISAILRRVASVPVSTNELIHFGDFTYNPLSGELLLNGEPVRLTERERDILKILAATPGETVPRYKLATSGDDINDRTVDVQVTRLRRKLNDDPTNPQYLQTVRGVGYRLAVNI
jgi:two-component system, OmpR family, phosphate regulon response regulator OmpR